MGRKNLLSSKEKEVYGGPVPRLVVQKNNHYEILKPLDNYPNPLSPSEWHDHGKQYSPRGIFDLYLKQNENGIKMYFFPSDLERIFSTEQSVKGLVA